MSALVEDAVNIADLDPNTVKNVLEESTLQNIRAYDHKDTNGNVIGKSDPHSSISIN